MVSVRPDPIPGDLKANSSLILFKPFLIIFNYILLHYCFFHKCLNLIQVNLPKIEYDWFRYLRSTPYLSYQEPTG